MCILNTVALKGFLCIYRLLVFWAGGLVMSGSGVRFVEMARPTPRQPVAESSVSFPSQHPYGLGFRV